MYKEKIKQIKETYKTSNLVDMVHQHLISAAADNQQKRYDEGKIGKYYPSSVGQCKRKCVYQMLGYPGSNSDGKGQLVLENGTSFHNRMEDIFEKMGIMIAPEVKLKNEKYRISGRTDALIWNHFMDDEDEPGEEIELYQPNDEGEDELVYKGPSNAVMLVEFKSIKSKGYNEYIPKTKPKKEHEMQLQLYFYLTGISMGMVYYENKDTQEQKYYIVHRDEVMIQEILKDIEFIIDYTDQGKLPEKEFQPTSFECRYCNYRDLCHPVVNQYSIEDLI